MKPAISQVCSLSSPFEKDLEEFSASGCGAVEIWLGKLEAYLESHAIADVRRLLDRYQIQAVVASFQGGLLTTQGDARRQHWLHFERRLPLLAQLGIEVLVLACDIAAPLTSEDLDRARRSLTHAGKLALDHGLRLALEPQARAAFGNNLQSAAALVAEANQPALGLCLDLFHYQVGPSKFEDLAYLHAGNLFHVQVCDLAGQPRELAADADRILPGDGDIPLAEILQRLRALGYEGYLSLELMNPQIWQVPARQLGEVGMQALGKLLDRSC